MPVYRQAATPPVFTTSLQFIGYLRRLLRNHEELAGFRLNPSTWSRGPSPLSDTQGRWNGAQCHVKVVQSRSRDAQSRWNGAQKSLEGCAKSFVFRKLLPLFGVDGSSGDLLIFPGPRRLASGERLRY